jgi:hypothetical protein
MRGHSDRSEWRTEATVLELLSGYASMRTGHPIGKRQRCGHEADENFSASKPFGGSVSQWVTKHKASAAGWGPFFWEARF